MDEKSNKQIIDELKNMPSLQDMVSQPPHYNNGSVECIDYIRQQLGPHYPGYLEGNVIKYVHRYKLKNSNIEDLRKARWYLSKLIEYYEA